jgi:hypothetical protein
MYGGMKMQITLYASIAWEEWKERMRFEGVIAGEVGGYTKDGGMVAILVQHTPFPLGSLEDWKQYVIVEFLKELSEIYVDYDDDVEAISEGALEDGSTTYEGFKGCIDDYCLFGAYVQEIRSEEIVAIHIGAEHNGKYYVDGKEE